MSRSATHHASASPRNTFKTAEQHPVGAVCPQMLGVEPHPRAMLPRRFNCFVSARAAVLNSEMAASVRRLDQERHAASEQQDKQKNSHGPSLVGEPSSLIVIFFPR